MSRQIQATHPSRRGQPCKPCARLCSYSGLWLTAVRNEDCFRRVPWWRPEPCSRRSRRTRPDLS